jgi:hypothetical protein
LLAGFSRRPAPNSMQQSLQFLAASESEHGSETAREYDFFVHIDEVRFCERWNIQINEECKSAMRTARAIFLQPKFVKRLVDVAKMNVQRA